MNKALSLSAAFAASAAIAWMVASPAASTAGRRMEGRAGEIPPRPSRKLTRVQVDADPAYTGALEKIRNAATTKDRLQAAYDLAHSIPDEDVEKWLEGKIFKEGDPSLVTFFQSILVGRFSEIAPEKCALYMAPSNDPGLRAHLKRWASVDHQSVIALAGRTTHAPARQYMLEAGLVELAKSDPSAVLATLEKEKELHMRLDDIVTVLAAGNRQLVLDWADHPKQEFERDKVRDAVAKAMFSQDFNAALSWVREQDDAGRLIGSSLKDFGLTPSGYVDKLGSLPVELLRSILMGATKRGEDLDAWISYDYEGKTGLSAGDAKKIRLTAIKRLAFVNTPKALEALKVHGLPDRGEDIYAYREAISGMNRGFEAMGGEVLDQWRELLGEDAKDLIRYNAMYESKLNYPVPPVDAVKQVAETGKISDTGFVKRWSREEMRQAIESLSSLSAEELQRFSDLVDVSGLRAWEFEEAVLAEGARKKAGFSQYSYANLGYRMAGENINAALAWTRSLPEGRPRDLTVRGIAAQMNTGNPGKADEWAAGLEPRERKLAEEVINHIRTAHAKDCP